MRTALLLVALLLSSCAERLDGKTADEWAAEMEDKDKGADAVARLQNHGAEATAILVAILEKAPPKPRIMAASLLARLGPDARTAVPALVAALKDKDRGLRGMAAIALGRIGVDAREAVVPLDHALSDKDVRVRVAASLALYGITGDSAAPTRVLFSALTSPDPDVRAMVAEGFAEMGTPIVEFLVRSLANKDETTRVSAAKTLGAMGSSAAEAQDALQRALEDRSEAVRAAAAEALTKIEPPR